MSTLDSLLSRQDAISHKLELVSIEPRSHEQQARLRQLQAQLSKLWKQLDAIYAEHCPTW
jgi:hypothetical protein